MGNEAETALYLARTPQMTHGTMGSGDNRHRTIPHPAPESWFLTQASCTCLAPFGGVSLHLPVCFLGQALQLAPGPNTLKGLSNRVQGVL